MHNLITDILFSADGWEGSEKERKQASRVGLEMNMTLTRCSRNPVIIFPTHSYSSPPLPNLLRSSTTIASSWERRSTSTRVLHFRGPLLNSTCSSPMRIRAALSDKSTNASAPQEVPKKSVSVILLAGGKGKRMGASMPKQYLPLLGLPIALYSFFTFSRISKVKEIIAVCDSSYRDIFEDAQESVIVNLKFASPGKERQDSVYNGLQEIDPLVDLVCVHDSARPLVSPEDVEKVLQDAWVHGAAVLGVPVKATIKEADNDSFVVKTLDRKTLWEMQTPQVIKPSLLQKGFELVQRDNLEVTDDVSIVEHLKHPVYVTQGSYTNIKVTTPDDLLVAERILKQD